MKLHNYYDIVGLGVWLSPFNPNIETIFEPPIVVKNNVPKICCIF